jgi:small conductance mechanosensitive channel
LPAIARQFREFLEISGVLIVESLRATLAEWFDWATLGPVVLIWTGRILAALAIFVIGRWIATRVARAVELATERARIDTTLTRFLRSVVYLALLVMVVVAALQMLGVPTASFLALLGAAGLAIGLAVKDSLSNFSSGVMLVFLRPFKVGDVVVAAGVEGTVDAISMTNTIIKTPDNRLVIVPNSAVYAGQITNYSTLPTRRIDLVFGASGEDIGRVREVIAKVLEADKRVLRVPEPAVMLLELVGPNVQIAVRPWVATDDYWTVRADLLEQIKLALEQNGLATPPPQQLVRLLNQA